jgi:hypothetical protein
MVTVRARPVSRQCRLRGIECGHLSRICVENGMQHDRSMVPCLAVGSARTSVELAGAELGRFVGDPGRTTGMDAG